MGSKELEGLVKRLEVTTQRLEALSAQKPGLAPKPPGASSEWEEWVGTEKDLLNYFLCKI